METGTFSQTDIETATPLPATNPPGDTWSVVYFDTGEVGTPGLPRTYDGSSVDGRYPVLLDHESEAHRKSAKPNDHYTYGYKVRN